MESGITYNKERLNILVIQSPFMKVTIGGTNFGGIESYVDGL